MRKVILFNLITLDGYFEGENQDLSWHNFDQEMADFVDKQCSEISTLLFGRKTYQMMASYWPNETEGDEAKTAEYMNSVEKVVFSRTLNSVDWNNSRLAKGDAAEEIRKLKQTEGGLIAIFGSSDLAASLASQNVIDEYRIMINPLFLGQGKTLLSGIKEKLNLKLISSRVFKNGNVLLNYENSLTF